ncbi:hypothetical protein GCM10022380_45110 [Amycolatopsis tucumanensis]|uniref:Uncharacterized protein n=1 Tax=Amycolatopsis tucumanensis TaxID=401106 RepID=A0ABP7IL79_9PSEU
MACTLPADWVGATVQPSGMTVRIPAGPVTSLPGGAELLVVVVVVVVEVRRLLDALVVVAAELDVAVASWVVPPSPLSRTSSSAVPTAPSTTRLATPASSARRAELGWPPGGGITVPSSTARAEVSTEGSIERPARVTPFGRFT